MNPDDRTLAREALIRRRLTIEQVTELQRDYESSGRTFSEAVVARKLMSPEEVVSILRPATPVAPSLTRSAPLFGLLIAGTLAILGILVTLGILLLVRRNERETRLAEESIAERALAEKRAREAAVDYQRSRLVNRETEARAALDKARATLKFAEERIREAPGEPQLNPHLVEATIGFNTWLQDHPDDAPVYVERSRAYELRRDFDRALSDLDRAIDLKKELAPAFDAKLQELRLQVARPKK